MSAIAPDVPLHAISDAILRACLAQCHVAALASHMRHLAEGLVPQMACLAAQGLRGLIFVARSAHHVPLHARLDG